MDKLRGLHKNLALAAVTSFLVGASSVHCGSSGANTTGFGAAGTGAGMTSAGTGGTTGAANGGSTSSGGDASLQFDVQSQDDFSSEQIYASDPFPMCDGGGMPPNVTGTPDCPNDKNLPGCPCAQQGEKAACWTGLRKNRNHGICHDGMTVCGQGETNVWGPCTGEQLPTGMTGKAACGCFSGGHWNIANLSPCFYTDANNNSGAISTTFMNGMAACPSDFTAAPSTSWSTDTLQADCTGSFKLCYTIKAGDGKMPQPTDCTIAQICSSGYYGTANVVQNWPDLPGWISDPSAAACVAQFKATGGYGQMSVDGQSDACEGISKVFQTVTYCPFACSMPNPPASCAQCQAGGGGSF